VKERKTGCCNDIATDGMGKGRRGWDSIPVEMRWERWGWWAGGGSDENVAEMHGNRRGREI